jgi:predicted DNA-binding protein
MAGFAAGLEGLGMGLGQFAQNYQRQQEQQQQTQLLKMKIAEFFQQQQMQKSAADLAASAYGGGGTQPSPIQPLPGASSPMGMGSGMGGAPPMPAPPPPSSFGPPVGGMARGGGATPPDPGLAWLNENAPFPTLAHPQPRPMSFTDKQPDSSVYAEANASGAPGTGNLTPSGGLPANAPPPRGGQPSSTPQPSGGIPPPPDPYDPGSVFRSLKQLHPEMDNRTLVAAVDLVGQRAAPQAKAAYDRWKAQADITLRQSGQAETGRHNVVEEGLAGQRIAGEATGRAETGRHNVVEEGLGQQRETETERFHKAAETGRDKALTARIGKQEQATTLATTQMKTLAARARSLYQAIEQDPSLVGGKGIIGRAVGSIGEQTGLYNDPKLAARDDFRAQLQLLQTQLQKPLLGSKYFSGKAQERLDAVVPGMGRLDNATYVKSALRNIAESLEETAGATEAAARGIGGDYQHLSDQELLQQLGVQPAAGQQ